MDGQQNITVKDAKAALRDSVQRPAEPVVPWYTRPPIDNPWGLVAAAAGVGLVIGLYPGVLRVVAPIVARQLLAQKAAGAQSRALLSALEKRCSNNEAV